MKRAQCLAELVWKSAFAGRSCFRVHTRFSADPWYKLNDSLEWIRQAPPVILLSNGELQLPLNVSESEMRRASKQQLQDLSKRRGEGKSRPLGGFGSSF